jgi:hypothetical protein
MKDSFDINKAFDNYVQVISTIATDLSFCHFYTIEFLRAKSTDFEASAKLI